MSETVKEREFLKTLPPELREFFEIDILKAELEKEIEELTKTIKPGFGGKATSKELERYSAEVYET